jgi:glycine/D-amino acid oxidase-like deaminating enzyme
MCESSRHPFLRREPLACRLTHNSTPAKFCQFVHAECTKLGLRTVFGRPTAFDHQTSLTVSLNDGTAEELPFTRLLLSAGPWTTVVAKQLGLPCPLIGNLPGHSIHIAPSPGWSDDLVGKSIFAGITDETEDSMDAIAWGGGERRGGQSEHGCTSSVELVSRSVFPAHKRIISLSTTGKRATFTWLVRIELPPLRGMEYRVSRRAGVSNSSF